MSAPTEKRLSLVVRRQRIVEKVQRVQQILRESQRAGAGAGTDAVALALQAVKEAEPLSIRDIEKRDAIVTLATAEMYIKQFDRAARRLSQVVRDANDALGVNATDVAILNNLAVALSEQGKDQEALRFHDWALRLKRQLFASDRAQLLGNLQDVCFLLDVLGRFGEAAAYLEEMRDIIGATVGVDHPDYARACENLAECHRARGDVEAASSVLQGDRKAGAPDEADYAEVKRLYNAGDFDRAEQAYRALLPRIPTPPLPAMVTSVMGNVFDPIFTFACDLSKQGAEELAQGRFDDACHKLERALKIFEARAQGFDQFVLGARNNLGNAWRQAGRLNQARSILEDLVIETAEAPEFDTRKVAVENLVAVYWDISEREAPELKDADAFLNALGERREDLTVSMRIAFAVPQEDEENASVTARQFEVRARFYERALRFDKAQFLLQHGLGLYRAVFPKDTPTIVRKLAHLAVFEDAHGFEEDGARHAREAQDLCAESGTGDDAALEVQCARALTLFSSRRDGEAELLLREVLTRLSEKGVASSLNKVVVEENLAVVLLRQGKRAEAAPLLERVLREADPATASPERLQQLATFAMELGQHEIAECYLAHALRGLAEERGEWSAAYALALSNSATLSRMRGDWEKAAVDFARVVEIRTELFGVDHRSIVEAKTRQALAQGALGRWSQAFDTIEGAIASARRVYGGISSIGVKDGAFMFANDMRTRLGVALTLVAKGDLTREIGRLYELVLHQKAMTAQISSLKRRAALDSAIPAAASLLRAYDEVSEALVRASIDPRERASQAAFAEARARQQEIEERLAAASPSITVERAVQAATLVDIAAALPPGAVLVEFVAYRPHVFDALATSEQPHVEPARYAAFVVGAGAPGDIQFVDVGAADAIDANVQAFCRDVERRGDIDSAARDLAVLVWEPIADSVADAHLVLIAPDRGLAFLPFEILPSTQGGMLLDRWEIGYLTTGRDVMLRAQSVFKEPGDPLILSGPDYDLCAKGAEASTWAPPRSAARGLDRLRPFKPLRGAAKEGRAVAAIAGGVPLEGAAATKGALRRASAPRILHLATHGFFLPGDDHASAMLRSGVVFAGANAVLAGKSVPDDAEDAILLAEDAQALDLYGTEMVVVSACQSGLGYVHDGEGVFGLRRAFIIAGARAVVMSLWSVPDAATFQLMTQFYEGLAQGLTKTRALRAAKLKVRETHAHPFFWAAFVVAGEPGAVAAFPRK